jgi:Reverse transcriptase (RNA-dependent DNA polymerase)
MPITLFNTISKIMDTVIAKRINYLVETHNLLLNTHIGGREKRSTEHALHTITENIYEAWNDMKIASLLLLDVSGAYDNVSHERLLYNLRKRKIDEKTVRWIARVLKERKPRIIVDGYTSESYLHADFLDTASAGLSLYALYSAII